MNFNDLLSTHFIQKLTFLIFLLFSNLNLYSQELDIVNRAKQNEYINYLNSQKNTEMWPGFYLKCAKRFFESYNFRNLTMHYEILDSL